MVEVGGKPILWHIMNIYAAHGISEFVVALGYRGDMIKSYFLNFCAANSNVTVDLVFDPPWDPSRMSDEAKLALNMF